MVLSVLPACTVFPADRLLFFVGIGGMGLLALFFATVLQNADLLPVWRWKHLTARALCVALIFIHLCAAPVCLARTAGSFKRSGHTLTEAADSLPSDLAAPFQTVLIVSSPTHASFAYSALTRLLNGRPYLSRTLVLGSGSQLIELHRPDERTLCLRPEDGFLASTGALRPGREVEQLLFDQRRAILALDWLYRDSAPMTIGRQINLLGATAEIATLTDDGRPAEVTFRFATKLESRLFRWMRWDDGAYIPFALPAVGETVTVPAATVPLWQEPGGSPTSSQLRESLGAHPPPPSPALAKPRQDRPAVIGSDVYRNSGVLVLPLAI
jgi:hypothetical protein